MARIGKTKIVLILGAFLILALLARVWLFERSSESDLTLPKTYTIARDPTWFPFDFFGKERQISAFSDDLLLAIAAEQKIQINIYTASSASLLAGLNSQTYDGVLSPISSREVFTQKKYLFSKSYFRFGPVVVLRIHSPFTKLSELEGGVVGVLRGSSTNFEKQGGSNLTYVPYDNLLIALQNLANGSLDGVIVKAIPAYIYTHGLFSDKLRVATAPLTGEGLRLFTVKDPSGQQLIEAFNSGLKKLKENGTYDALLKQWDLVDPEIPTPQVIPKEKVAS